jgi:hypothetical protein
MSADVERGDMISLNGPAVTRTLLPPTMIDKLADPVHAAAAQAARSAVAVRRLSMVRLAPLLGRVGLFVQLAARAGLAIGSDEAGHLVTAHLVAGRVAQTVLVIGGVHGSEQSGVEVVQRLLTQLRDHQPHYTVVVVPQLFAANGRTRREWDAALAAAHGELPVSEYRRYRDAAGDPGRISPAHEDPNRQFPGPGVPFDASRPFDSHGRVIESPNLALHALLTEFQPIGIVSVHAISDPAAAGIYADPQPAGDDTGLASAAEALAIAMAVQADAWGLNVSGNRRGGGWSSLYPGQDPGWAPEYVTTEAAKGCSLGQWAPTRGYPVITMEVGEQYRSGSVVDDPGRATELAGLATVIRETVLRSQAAFRR